MADLNINPDPPKQGESESEYRIRTNRTTAADGYPKGHPKNPDTKEKSAAKPPSKK